jgi:hypothetical protein
LNRRFYIDFRHSVGNLHIYLYGEFNGMCAWELIKIIKQQYFGTGRLFINTAGLNQILPAGVDLLNSHMTCKKIPADWMYFKGKKGFKIAPDGSRVLICKKTYQPNKMSSHRSEEAGRTFRRLK